MVERKAQAGLETAKVVVLIVGIVAIIGVLTIIILGNLHKTDIVDNSIPIISEDTFFNSTSNPLTLSNTSTGITSVQTKNDTWREFIETTSDSVLNFGYNESFSIGTDDFSLSIWLNLSNLNPSVEATFVKQGGGSPSQEGYWFRVVDGSGQLQFYVANGTNSASGWVVNNLRPDTAFPIGEWAHVAVVMNRSENFTVYVNGEFNATTDVSSNEGVDITSPNDFVIGGASNRDWNGSIDEVRIYKKTLTTDQVNEIYNSGRIPNASLTSDNLTFWSSFNENQGTTAYDKVSDFEGTSTTAPYGTDGIDIDLDSSDYTATSTLFSLNSDVYAYQPINITYGSIQGTDYLEYIESINGGVTDFFSNTGTWMALLAVVVIVLIISIVIFVTNRFGGSNVGL